MSQDEHTGAAPDDAEKPPQTAKKQQGKRRSPGARPDAETPPKHDGGGAEESEEADVVETSAEQESGASGQALNPPGPDKQHSATEKAATERHEIATKEEPKPRGLGEILRFRRKSARRPR
jgi:hypothetical protein